MTDAPPTTNTSMSRRFRGFLPVVIDVETGGFDVATHALLEIAAVMIDMEPDGTLKRGATHSYHVRPFEGSRLDPAALSITGIDPFHPLRPALPEKDALGRVFREIRHAIHGYNCRRAILVGHNAAFDLAFLNAAIARAEVKRNPFHPFSCFDTATLAGAALGQTVLAKALAVAGLEWDQSSAHSASYDAEKTADIFCLICNRLKDSFRDAQERACALGWQNAPPVEALADEPRLTDVTPAQGVGGDVTPTEGVVGEVAPAQGVIGNAAPNAAPTQGVVVDVATPSVGVGDLTPNPQLAGGN